MDRIYEHMNARILVADDERVIREGCGRLLRHEGWDVLMVVNGREALDVLASESVDVILCDLKMPVMGAVEVLEEVHEQKPSLPFIVITGHGTVASAVECIRKGAYDFVTKPFRAAQLITVVRRAIEGLPPLPRLHGPKYHI